MLDITIVKKHLRVDHDEEDDLIEHMMDSAKSQCLAYLNRSVFETQAELDAAIAAGDKLKHPIVLQPHHIQAILVLVAEFYRSRESSDEWKGGLPMGVRSLLWADRIREV